MPHLAIEALGHIYAASAAHGISKAVMWGAGARAQQRRAITKYMVQIILGAVLIILGACLESYWVPWSMRTIAAWLWGLGSFKLSPLEFAFKCSRHKRCGRDL